MTISGWIGVDLDGTAAVYHGWNNGEIGEPIPATIARMKAKLAEGVELRIFTARVGIGAGFSAESGRSDDMKFVEEQTLLIEAWCELHVGQKLKVTAMKDFAMIELWDDRAIQFEMNTGWTISERHAELSQKLFFLQEVMEEHRVRYNTHRTEYWNGRRDEAGWIRDAIKKILLTSEENFKSLVTSLQIIRSTKDV